MWSDSNDAVFGVGTGTAGTVTVASQVTPNSITFNPAGNGNYVLTGRLHQPAQPGYFDHPQYRCDDLVATGREWRTVREWQWYLDSLRQQYLH